MIDWDVLKTKTDLGSVFSYEYESLIPMQFTGLHDKNGKEIYEGDIIETYIGSVYFVDFNYGGYCLAEFGHTGDADKLIGTYDPSNYLTVIGNIYENPELLTKENK